MKVSKGGTSMYCPGCKDIADCKALPAAKVTLNTIDYYQRRYFRDHNDINWFQRGRRCLSCGHEFVTGEVNITFLRELVELRDALKEIKDNAEAYVKESSAASQSLEKLSESLSVLRALNIYKNI